MIEKPLHTKKELKRLFMDLKNKGITDEMMGILIEVLWRDNTSSRSAGFFWPGGPDLSLNWDDVSRTLTLTPAPALDPESEYVPHFRFFSFVSKPVLHRRYNPDFIILPNEEGLYAIYYDVNPDTRLQALTYTINPDEFETATIIMDKVLVAWIYYDAVAGKALYFGDSRYGSEWPPQIHFWAHKTLNSLRQEGLAITDATYEGTGLFESDTDFNITAGKLWHEDIFAETPEVPLGQEIPVWYFDQNGLPRYTSQAGKKIFNAGSGLLAYNPPTAGIAEASDLNYVVYHYFATNCVFQPHIAVMGKNKYTLRSLASAAISTEVILLKDSLPHSNLLHIGSIIFQTSHDYANSSKARAIFGTDEVGVTSIFTEEDPDFPIDYLKYIIGNKTINVTDIFKPNGILAGGYVSWSGGLSFIVTPVAGRIMRELYKILTYKNITLTAADPTYPRIDLIVMDDTPSITFLTGIPAVNPQKPTVNPAKQIELTHVLIPAAASEPAGVSGDIIYDENIGEWIQTVNGVIVNFDYAIDPFSGLKCANVGSIGTDDTILFTASAPLNISDYETFIASLKLKEATTKQHILYVEFMLLGAVVSSPVTLMGASVSLDWQVLALKFANITFNAAQFDAVRLRWSKSGAATDHPGFFLDRVKLEKGITQPVTGADGKDGATWYSGTYQEPLGIGKTGDWFFDTGTVLGDIYQCTGGPHVWTWRMNIAPRIGANGNWIVNNQDTGIKAEGTDGDTPEIGLDGYWYIGGVNTGVLAEGQDGAPGADGDSAYQIAVNNGFVGTEAEWLASLVGADGTSPHIDATTGNWFIGTTDTGVKAAGTDGREVAMRENAGWVEWQYVGDAAWTQLYQPQSLTKATGADIATGTDDAKYVTPKAIKDSNVLQSAEVKLVVALTQAEYDAIGTKVNNTLYLING